MVGILITGHGNFAEGIESALEVIIGAQPQLAKVNFLKEDSTDTLKENMTKAIESVDTGDGIMIFSDLVGGSPFKTASLLAIEKGNIEVLGGTNIQSIMEIAFMRELPLKQVSQKAIESAKAASQLFELKVRETDKEDEEGI